MNSFGKRGKSGKQNRCHSLYLLAISLAFVLDLRVAHSEPDQQETQHILVRKYCVGCHNGQRKIAGLNLGDDDLSQVAENAQVWEKVIRKVRAGSMPPAGLPRPDRAALDRFASYLETSIDMVAVRPDPGPSVLRRLNRAEYGAAIRDLLDLNVDVASLLPADDSNNGFDNNTDSLSVSPALLEAYLAASRRVSRLAVGDPTIPPAFFTYRVRADLGQDTHLDGLPLGTRGGLLVEHNFPLDGTYILRTKLAVNTSAKVRGLDYQYRFIVIIDGVKVQEAKVGGPDDVNAAALNPPESDAEIVKRLEIHLPIEAGPHKVGVTFVRKTNAQPDGYLQPWLRTNFDTQEQRGVPLVESISIGGPFAAKDSGDTPSRRKIFTCRPSGSQDIACARRILETLAQHAYRRPVRDADIETLMSLYQSVTNAAGSGDPFEAGIEKGLRFILNSPAFLFRVETDAANALRASVHRLNDLDLASRISFFLWSSLPDDELLRLGNQGLLNKTSTLEAQIQRMLADPRAQALSTNFAAQWLYLRNLASTTRDLDIFPYFDDNLRQGFRQETEMFFDSVVREDRSALELLSADYTFVNERLAGC